jgi:hypothetical protein
VASDDKKLFEDGDLELLLSALQLIPDLEAVAYATKLARKKLKFPLKSRSALRPLFDSAGSVRFRESTIKFAQVERFLPDDFFPIESERAFMTRALIAFQIARTTHQQEEAIAARRKKLGRPSTHLPSPMPPGVGVTF